MSFMPFAVSIGPVLGSLEAQLRDPTRRAAVLTGLRNLPAAPTAADIMGLGVLPDFGLAVPGSEGDPYQDTASHVLIDWFGFTYDGAAWTVGDDHSHWWAEWEGAPLPTFLEGMIAALELSLGLLPGEPIAAARRTLPLSFSWSCPVPRFETHIRWSHDPPGGQFAGFVEVTFITPGVKPERAAMALAPDATLHELPGAAQTDLDGHMIVAPTFETKAEAEFVVTLSPLGEWEVEATLASTGPVPGGPVHRVIIRERDGGAARRSWPAGQWGTQPGEIPGHTEP